MQDTIEVIGNKGTAAVKKLRQQKLENGLPFMINDKDLFSNQCYMEYPDGSIKLVTITSAGSDVHIERELTLAEADRLRNRFHFSNTH